MDLYEQVPYPSLPYKQSHPDRLATLAHLFGLRPRRVTRSRVIEIGCNAGGNLIPMAATLPGTHFVGVDGSAAAIESARKTADGLGLSNLELHCADLRDWNAEGEPFDYVICHAVYSWVSPAVQTRILELCRSWLSPQGVAYVSYNTLPGWHGRNVVRDMMLFHSGKFAEPADQIRQATSFLEFLIKAQPDGDGSYRRMLEAELALLRRRPIGHWFHDMLEPENHACYFQAFAERASAAGLQYLCEADLASMSSSDLGPKTTAVLDNISRNSLELEQYLDFVRNCSFRQTLLCRAEHELQRPLQAERVERLFAAVPFEPVDRNHDVRSSERCEFRGPRDVRFSTSEPLLKAALFELGARWPEAIAFEKLLKRARKRIGIEGDEDSEPRRRLAQHLLECNVRGVAELRTRRSDFRVRVTAQPCTSELARWQAGSSALVTSLHHESQRLDALERWLLQRLDGSRTTAALIEALLEDAADLLVSEDDEKELDAAQRKSVASDRVHRALERFARTGLLR